MSLARLSYFFFKHVKFIKHLFKCIRVFWRRFRLRRLPWKNPEFSRPCSKTQYFEFSINCRNNQQLSRKKLQLFRHSFNKNFHFYDNFNHCTHNFIFHQYFLKFKSCIQCSLVNVNIMSILRFYLHLFIWKLFTFGGKFLTLCSCCSIFSHLFTLPFSLQYLPKFLNHLRP